MVISYDNLWRRRRRLVAMGGPSSKVTATLDITGIRGNNLKSAEQIIFELIEIDDSIDATKEMIDSVDRLLIEMSSAPNCQPWYGKFLREWYIDNVPRSEIEQHFDMSKRSLYNMRDEALQAFADVYFGIRSLERA